MKHPFRMGLFAAGAIGLAAIFALAIFHMPPPHISPYGQAVNHLSLPDRHVTDAVTNVNFDVRGFDTLGEEFILFVSVMGAIVLLREETEKKHAKRIDALEPRRVVEAPSSVRVITMALVGPTVLFGIYVVIHGQLTPGGGFQGGVILATAPLLVYLTENYDAFKSITSNPLIEVVEAIGAGGYALIGILGWIAGKQFLENVMPLGPSNPPSAFSGGTIALIDLAVGLEVAAGFTLLLAAFLQHTMSSDQAQ
jgi:multicomponent Na+:H+ antiporter subunit B